eukprot:3805717-Ditylum_brightwellii.AAC.1
MLSNESFAPGRVLNKTQQCIVCLGDKAKSKNFTDIDYTNASGKLEFKRGQIQYLKQLTKQVCQSDGAENEGTDTDQLLNYFESMKDCRIYGESIYLGAREGKNEEE